MNESIMEFKVKDYLLKADKKSVTVFNGDELLFKANYLEIKALGQWLFSKMKELKHIDEIKEIETKE